MSTYDFMIIGGQRCGTSALWSYLQSYPQIAKNTKESHFFDRDANFDDENNCIKQPNVPKTDKMKMEATPSYLFYPKVPARIKKMFPDTKFITLLRDPIDRAYSHYCLARYFGWVSGTFEDALAEEESILKRNNVIKILGDNRKGLKRFEKINFKSRGCYAEQLDRWFSHFPKEQLLIMKSSGLWTNARAAMNELEQFLGLETKDIAHKDSATARQVNFNTTDWMETGQDTPEWDGKNKTPPVPMRPETRNTLMKFFAPYNQALCDLTGIEFP